MIGIKNVLILIFMLNTVKFSNSKKLEINCITNSSSPDCKNYIYPDPCAVVTRMCNRMNNMPTCTVKTRVCDRSEYHTNRYCQPFSLMADVCTDMIMGEQGCNDYVSMCSNGTVIDQCFSDSLKYILPTYNKTKFLVSSICSSMPMDRCEQCKEKCDYFSVYSDLCIQMPEMPQCRQWEIFCKVVPDWPFCVSSTQSPPIMKMYFHDGIKDYVLFKGWVPQNILQYVLTCFAVAFASILLEALRFLRAKLEFSFSLKHKNYTALNESENDQYVAPWSPSVDILRGLLNSIEVTWGLFIMLIAMTYNVGLFLSLILGSFIGTLIFGRFLVSYPKVSPASCH